MSPTAWGFAALYFVAGCGFVVYRAQWLKALSRANRSRDQVNEYMVAMRTSPSFPRKSAPQEPQRGN